MRRIPRRWRRRVGAICKKHGRTADSRNSAAGACLTSGILILSECDNQMICSFADRDTESLFHGRAPRRIPPTLRERARRKLDMINAASSVEDLRTPPGNMLEALHGDRKGQLSIRVNDQWRVCFAFREGHAFDVQVVDYH